MSDQSRKFIPLIILGVILVVSIVTLIFGGSPPTDNSGEEDRCPPVEEESVYLRVYNHDPVRYTLMMTISNSSSSEVVYQTTEALDPGDGNPNSIRTESIDNPSTYAVDITIEQNGTAVDSRNYEWEVENVCDIRFVDIEDEHLSGLTSPGFA